MEVTKDEYPHSKILKVCVPVRQFSNLVIQNKINKGTISAWYFLFTHPDRPCTFDSNLQQVEDLLAQVQLKVCVVGARHVVNEHQAVPLRLKAVEETQTQALHSTSGK